MSQRGADFLKEWIQKNINAVAYSSLYDTRAKVMAEQCAADGCQIGICVGEIEVETGDLTDCMLRAMAAREQAAGRRAGVPTDSDASRVAAVLVNDPFRSGGLAPTSAPEIANERTIGLPQHGPTHAGTAEIRSHERSKVGEDALRRL
jgi:hypothetical protein